VSNKEKKSRHPVEAVEGAFERIVFAARWLLAPFYIGMIVALGVLLIKFIGELWHVVLPKEDLTASEVVLAVLSLVDLSLIANLLIIVIFAGYENFVSQIDVAKDHPDRPSWMGKVDFGGLKMKVIGSLVAISSIELLKDFIESAHGETPNNLKWRIFIHLVFLLSGVMFALMDWISAKREALESEFHVDISDVD